MMGWTLPEAVTVGGESYPINSDYRDILEIIGWLSKHGELAETRFQVALHLFYEDFSRIPPDCYTEAVQELLRFINCGEEDTQNQPAPKRIDWEQDQAVIVSEINRVAGTEVRTLPYLHWWTFIGYFSAVGEGQLSALVSIRNKLQKGKKLDDWEKEYYRENKRKIDFQKQYSAEELGEIERLNALLGG